MSTFHIREEVLLEDVQFILEAFDSTLPHLASIGSGAQWGSEPRSTQESSIKRMQEAIEKARSGTNDTDAVFVAELPVDNSLDLGIARVRRHKDGQRLLQVGAAVTEGSFPAYITGQPNLTAFVQAAMERTDFLYLFVLISDFRAGALRKGAGTVLTERVKQYAREKGKAAVYLDCWSGNDEKLVRYVSNMHNILFSTLSDAWQLLQIAGFRASRWICVEEGQWNSVAW